MTVRRVNPEHLAPPIGFSHAVVAEGSTIVFLAGQTALNADNVIVGETMLEQFEQAFGNLLAALAEAGGEPANLAKLTMFCTDVPAYRAQAREIGAAWKRMAGRDYPAMALIGVSRLWDDEAMLEIEGIAVLP